MGGVFIPDPRGGHVWIYGVDSAGNPVKVKVDADGRIEISQVDPGQLKPGIYAYDGSAWYPVKVDSDGHLQVDVLNVSNLPVIRSRPWVAQDIGVGDWWFDPTGWESGAQYWTQEVDRVFFIPLGDGFLGNIRDTAIYARNTGGSDQTITIKVFDTFDNANADTPLGSYTITVVANSEGWCTKTNYPGHIYKNGSKFYEKSYLLLEIDALGSNVWYRIQQGAASKFSWYRNGFPAAGYMDENGVTHYNVCPMIKVRIFPAFI